MLRTKKEGYLLNFFTRFRYSPKKKELRDPSLIQSQYAYWRLRIFYSMYMGYAFFYLTRRSLAAAMPAMITNLGMTEADLGILASVLYFSYGFSKFLSGVLSDRSNPRYFMASGLILTGVMNIFFGFSSNIVLFILFWGLNGWFQGWGWPPCAKLLTHWYSRSERGIWWGIWNSSHNVGGGVAAVMVSILAAQLGWRMGMCIPGIACIIAGLFLINRLRDTPQSLGLPAIEKYRQESVEDQKQDEEGTELSQKDILVKYVLKNPYIWMLAAAYFFVYVIRMVVNDWSQLYLNQGRGISYIYTAYCIVSFEIGGILGSLAGGWVSDKVFGGNRGPVNVLFSLLAILGVVGFWYTPTGGFVYALALMFVLGFSIFGPQMLIGMVACELSHKRAAGTATGFIGWFAYFGAAAAGYPFGLIIRDHGWSFFFIALTVCAVISTVLLFPFWYIRSRRVEKEAKGLTA